VPRSLRIATVFFRWMNRPREACPIGANEQQIGRKQERPAPGTCVPICGSSHTTSRLRKSSRPNSLGPPATPQWFASCKCWTFRTFEYSTGPSPDRRRRSATSARHPATGTTRMLFGASAHRRQQYRLSVRSDFFRPVNLMFCIERLRQQLSVGLVEKHRKSHCG
jgi:hypothetical protein